MNDLLKLQLFIGGTAKGKSRPRSKHGGPTYTPHTTRSYEAKITYAAQKAMGTNPPVLGPIALMITVVASPADSWPAWKKQAALAGDMLYTAGSDLDNHIKVVDALNGVVWKDDVQVVVILGAKRYGTRPGLRVDIRELPMAHTKSKQADLPDTDGAAYRALKQALGVFDL